MNTPSRYRPFGLVLLFVLVLTSSQLVAAGEPAASTTAAAGASAADLKLMLSSPQVLQTMHQLTSRYGMRLAEITSRQETAEIVSHRFTYMGGAAPQDTGIFTVRIAPEGPPPVHPAVINVSRPMMNFVTEGPPPQ